MKFLVCLLLTLGLSSTSANDDECLSCTIWIKDLLSHETTVQNLEQQESRFLAEVCPKFADEAGCVTGVLQWWPVIAPIFMVDSLFTHETCTTIGCSGFIDGGHISSPKRWDCSSCENEVQNVRTAFQEPALADFAVNLLQGQSFCSTMVGGQEDACKYWVAEFLPLALPVLGNQIEDDFFEICAVVYGVCPDLQRK